MAAKIKETDLYPPLAAFLQQEGYTLHAEVLGTDIAALRGQELLLVEMKLHFNIEVLLQAVGKQGAADKTYIAIPSRKGKGPANWRAVRDMLRRLGIGLFLVHFIPPAPPQAEEVLAAEDSRSIKTLRKQRKVRARLIREMEGRPANFNTGGSVKTKLVTAYFVSSLRIALLLRENAQQKLGLPARGKKIRAGAARAKTGQCPGLTPKALRDMGAPQNCWSILYNNYHGWYMRLGKGLYALSAAGEEALQKHDDVIKSFP
jgi:hypothetical protein